MIEALSEEQWRSWEDQGYVRLGVQLSAAEVAELQRRCDDLMMGTADDVDFSMLRMVREKPEGGIRDGIGQDIGHRGATLEYSKFQGLEHDPVFHRLMSQPLMRNTCLDERVYGSAAYVAVYRATVFNKPAESGGSRIGWHQDQWRYLDTEPRVTFYVAIDRATVATGCLQVLPTTNRERVVFNRLEEDGSVDACGHLRPEQVDTVLSSAPAPVALELEPGEVVVLSNYIVHSSGAMADPAAAAGGPRRAFSLCLMDGSTRRPDGSPLGATILFGNDAVPAQLGNDPETRRGMLGATASDGLWDPAVAAPKL